MKNLFLFLAILVFASCASSQSSQRGSKFAYTPTEARYQKKYSYTYKKGTVPYTIKKGDTLWEIAKEYGVSTKELMRANKISSSSAKRLKVGQKLSIPVRYNIPKGLAFSWPLKGNIANFFGENVENVTNTGINIRANGNALVKASESGEVVFANYLKGWGDTLILKHSHDYYTIYANLAQVSAREGTDVKRGQQVGTMASDNVLHFEIRKKHLPQDPLKFLK